MGICPSTDSNPESRKEKKISRKIDNEQADKKAQEQRIYKLLLLGTGESGKSTIFRQMRILYAKNAFSEHSREVFRHIIRKNIIEALQALINACHMFKFKMATKSARASAKAVRSLDLIDPNFWNDEIVTHVKNIWGNAAKGLQGDPAIKQTYQDRHKFQLNDTCAYFFENIERIAQHNYVPTIDDILRARLRTTGIVEELMTIDGVQFKFLDVGGQRNERRKWIHCFQGVTAIIFVAAISEYDQMLYEDETQNRLHESLRVFEEICNKSYFVNTSMILFLNKTDIFEEKIKLRDLTCCFPEYKGSNGDPDFAKEYIQRRFLNANKQVKRQVYPHFTTATDTQLVKRVFDDCRQTIVSECLKRSGLDGPLM